MCTDCFLPEEMSAGSSQRGTGVRVRALCNLLVTWQRKTLMRLGLYFNPIMQRLEESGGFHIVLWGGLGSLQKSLGEHQGKAKREHLQHLTSPLLQPEGPLHPCIHWVSTDFVEERPSWIKSEILSMRSRVLWCLFCFCCPFSVPSFSWRCLDLSLGRHPPPHTMGSEWCQPHLSSSGSMRQRLLLRPSLWTYSILWPLWLVQGWAQDHVWPTRASKTQLVTYFFLFRRTRLLLLVWMGLKLWGLPCEPESGDDPEGLEPNKDPGEAMWAKLNWIHLWTFHLCEQKYLFA